jgi:REP element-mobilizing transposase RayT
MDRYWLLTWTTYGTWLPGDERGFVSNVANAQRVGERHNTPGSECDADMPALQQWMQQRLVGGPLRLNRIQAEALLAQFQETARYRGWELLAVAVMANHVHLVVGVKGDPEPADLLRDFKSYGSRALNRQSGKPASGTWWTESGSRRKLPNSDAVHGAVHYVKEQEYPLIVWIASSASGASAPC